MKFCKILPLLLLLACSSTQQQDLLDRYSDQTGALHELGVALQRSEQMREGDAISARAVILQLEGLNAGLVDELAQVKREAQRKEQALRRRLAKLPSVILDTIKVYTLPIGGLTREQADRLREEVVAQHEELVLADRMMETLQARVKTTADEKARAIQAMVSRSLVEKHGTGAAGGGILVLALVILIRRLWQVYAQQN